MHGGAPGSGAPRGNKNALKHGLYTREAIEQRRQLRALMRQSRMLISRHRVSAAAAYRIGNPVRQPAAVSRKVSDESMDIALRLCGSPPRVASRR
jgi:uncharacterized protein YjcR